MKSLSTSLLLIVLGLFTLVGSCKKEESAPTPTTPLGNAITANPTVTGLTTASVSADASGSTYTITVPAGTDVKNLKITIPLTTGSTIDPDPTVARDYTNPVTYTIIKTDGSKQTVTVKVVVLVAPKSSEKQITTFSFAALSPAVSATIDQSTRKISATVSSTTDVTKLVPTIVVSTKASVAPASGVAQNFTNPVNYTVTAEDGGTQVYEVKVEKGTVVTSNKACLLTKREKTSTNNTGSTETNTFNPEYDQEGRIIKIPPFIIGYDANGDVSQISSTSSSNTIRFTYQNRKVIKMEEYDANNKLVGDAFAQGFCKFNDNNEMIEYNPSGYRFKLEYVNGNLTKYDMYYEETKTQTITNITYDTKNSPLAASKPHRILTFLLFLEFPGFTNNPISLTQNNKTVTINYTYNANNFPTEAKGADANGKPFSEKYTYSNCQ